MGMSKALMEKVAVAKGRNLGPNQTVICRTRYGNVMASRGSVIPLFLDQIKDGKQLTITVGIGGGGTMNHPSAPILTQMANDMDAMGAELIIQDIDFSTLTNKVDAGELDMWVMAWGNSTDCDLTQIFGSKGNDNDTKYFSKDIDALQAQILQTVDFNERCKLVAQELDLIMDAAIYMPVYQRKNMEIYNASTIKLETLPTETTTYWDYADQIEKLEMQ
jgi:peptide/nickel transport system substrate-binding protein